MKRFIILLLSTSSILFYGCPGRQPIIPPDPPVQASQIELTADSVYLYSKEAYYWNSTIPDYNTFNPRQYKGETELKTAEAIMQKIRSYSENNLDRWSYATTYEQGGGLVKSGDEIDWGFFVKSGFNSSGSFKGWFVSYVYPDSDAGKDGVKRGWKINKIDGTTLLYTQASTDILNRVFINSDVGASAQFEFQKPDGTTQIGSYSIKKFKANPILYQEVITDIPGKNVGYFVYNRFFNTDVTALVDLFSYFQNQQVNELVVDLRYNLGGVTTTQDALADLIAPLSANGSVMYYMQYNQQLQNNQYPLLKNKFRWPNNFFTKAHNTEYFYKRGDVNLQRVFFIVSDNTASASELLINNLKPVMDVKLIGDGKTRGKPVGYFGVDLFEKITFYPISFQTFNKNDASIPFSGVVPDFLDNRLDGVDKDWGNRNEGCLFSALYYIQHGVSPPINTIPRSVAPELKLEPKELGTTGLIKLFDTH